MDFGLKSKLSLVTAASNGIGLGIAKVLAAEGSRVVISSRNKEALDKASKQISSETGNSDVFSVVCDLSDRQHVERMVDEVSNHYGSVDILAYNSGPPKPGTFAELSLGDWDYAVNLLLMSAVLLTKRVVPRMVERRWGRLIYITSLTLKNPLSNLVLSNTVRLSVAGLSKSLALELGGKGITSNGILQGHILTDRVNQLLSDRSMRTGKSVEELKVDQLKEVPAGRFGKAEEIGYLVAFLASDKAAYINGAMINIDGGLIKSVL
jgi:3-oxoacyl-[acyl-carrier protein] reductase